MKGVYVDVDKEVKNLLQKLRQRVEASDDGAIYGDRSKALKDIDSVLASSSIVELGLLLLPTSNLQELAIENGWGHEFNDMVDELGKIVDI